jgi:hypothetical protein
MGTLWEIALDVLLPQRSYNQAELLAREVAAATGLSLLDVLK